MTTPQTPSNPLRLLNAKDAREQACEFLGFMASVVIDLGDGTRLEIPNPSVLDPDAQDRYDELEFECEQLDRHPAPIDKETGEPLIGPDGQPVKGPVMMPHRIDGVRQENYETRLAKAILGDAYEVALAAGFYPSQLGVHWAEMRRAAEEREKNDSKSVGSDSPVGDVPEADSGGT